MTKFAPRVVLLFVVAALSATAQAQRKAEEWRAADVAVTRLEPRAFPELPANLRADLAERQCTVPQPFGAPQPANVMTGKFTDPGHTDWAVLCSRNRVSTILVYPSGTTKKVHELGSSDDSSYLQVVAGGAIGFSRQLSVAAPAVVSRYLRRDGAPATKVSRQGIEDAFVGKASSVWYWNGARWLRLAAAD